MFENMPLISVIVSVYNTDTILNKCLDSVINQTYKNLEIIIIDDGSTDNSPEICDSYKCNDNRVKVVHKKNEGQSIARNYAIDICKGKYVYFADSDDFLDKDLLSIMYKNIVDNSADVAICNITCSNDIYNKILIDEIGGQLWKFLFDIKLWDSIRLPENRYAEDAAVIYKLLYNKKIAVVPQELYHYNINNPESSSNRSDKYFKNCIDRAIMFIDRYNWLDENFLDNIKSTVLTKAVITSIGVLGLYKNFDYSTNDIQKIIDFFKQNIKEIKKLRIGGGRKIALLIINASPSVYYRIKNIYIRNKTGRFSG